MTAGGSAGRARPRSTPFAGRQKELDALAGALGSASAGEGGVVLIHGEAGIGKTRLAREFARLAEQQGAVVLWGNCYEDEGAPPYRPWAEIVAAYLDRAGLETARLHMGDGAADLAEIAPAVRLAMPDLPTPPRIEPFSGRPEELGQMRYRLADSMERFLGAASTARPLLLVFDSLQYCDRASLWMLELVAQDAAAHRMLIIATYTEREAQQRSLETLGELDKLPWSHRVRVGALGRDEVDSLVRQTLGSAAEPGLLEEIWRKTEGVPLFVSEALKCLAGRTLEGAAWETEVAGMVRAAVSRRLNKMPDEHRDLLAAAAVLGRELTPHELASVVQRDPAFVEHALDDSVSLGIVDEVGPARYRFTHDLVQEAVAGLLSAGARADLHMRIGRTLERLRKDGEAVDASRIAHHHRLAGDTGRAGLVRWAAQAGEDALAARAPENAVSAFDTALARLPADSSEGAQLLLRKAYALVLLGRDDEASVCVERAFACSVAVADIAGIVDAAEFPFLSLPLLRRQALALVAPDSRGWARIASRLIINMNEISSDAECARLYRKSIAIARREGDRALELVALRSGAWIDHYRIRPWWHPRAMERGIELSRELGDLWIEAWLRTMAAWEALYVGNATRAREHAARLAEAAKELCNPAFHSRAASAAVVIHAAAGEWKACSEILEPRLARGETNPILLSQAALFHTQVGEIERAKELLETLALLDERRAIRAVGPAFNSLYQSRAACAAWAAFARVAGGDRELSMAEQLAHAILQSDQRPEFRAYARLALALAALQEHDMRELETQLANELLIGPCYLSVWAMMVVDRVRALCAAALGRDEEARTYFQSAYDFCRNAGYRPELAWTCYDWGCFDKDRSPALLDEAAGIAADLGMKPLAQRIQQRQAHEALPRADRLTQREIEVVRFAAAGKANKEIADALCISYHTVVNHLKSIYRKTGVHSRAALATWAARRLTR